MPDPLPPDVAALLAQRSARRADRDWPAADALRDRIRALGWDPVDSPSRSTARPILPEDPDPNIDFAAASDLASLIDAPATRAASVVIVAEDHPADVARFCRASGEHPPAVDWELIVVANAPAFDPGPLAEAAGADAIDIVRSEQRLGWADAVNLGLRRARGAVVVVVDASLEPTGDWIGPLLATFADPLVGIAGGWGVRSADARQFSEAPPGDVDAIEGYCLAVRREALQVVRGFDRRFRWYRNADLDLSFAVRDAGWRAVATDPLPLMRHAHRGWESVDAAERDRLSRRNFYRFLDHWGDRRDLLLAEGWSPRRPPSD